MRFNLELKNKNLEVEINGWAEQANGSCQIKCGDTLVLTACTMSDEDRENLGFFPLTVEYQEKYYASGKIKGARYVRREGKPSDEAICNSRLIDRAIRPLFPKNLKREVQVVSTVLSWDGENDPDILSLISASIALSVSDIPWSGPVGAVRVSKIGEELLINSSYEKRQEKGSLDIVFAGTEREKELLINMIEGNASEVSEKEILDSYDLAEEDLKKIIEFQKEIQKKIGREKLALKPDLKDNDLEKEIKSILKDKLEKSFFQKDKTKRSQDLKELSKKVVSFIEEKYKDEENLSQKLEYANNFFNSEQDRLLHESVVKYNKRVDGRKLDEVRDISCQVGLVPRAHGSGFFCRGLTKALSILTLGAPGDEQLIEGMEIACKKKFMHHYNFPPYSAGEVRPMRGPGRREIGHGTLAEKALSPLLPDSEKFPYTIRIVSEILSSNGSTSQASISSSSLALMDAGVPIKRPAAGIAIGLAKNKEEWKTLTDIQGPEDHHGDMDFKVAGTTEGITAIQMDVKIDGITREIIEEALRKAKKAREEILEEMKKVISAPRKELSAYAPRILTLQINPEKIRSVIGPGGKVINEIINQTGAQIDIEDSGLIFITAEKEEGAKKAVSWIKKLTKEVKVGEIFEGKVKKIMDFGAFVEILPGQEGLVHISKLSDKRIKKVEDVIKLGDEVAVKVIEIDSQGRINLSLIKKH